MRETFPYRSNTVRHLISAESSVTVGLIGGLVGTVVMDLFGTGVFLVLGMSASLSFSIIGDAAAAFLALLGIQVSGGVPLGAVLHYLIGLALGGILGAALSRAGALHLDSMKKGIGLGILYVEVMSMPMLVAATLVLQMTASETVQWFGISIVMHLVYGLVLGLIMTYRLRAASEQRRISQ